MIIKFKTVEDRYKGLDILLERRDGFYGNNQDEFHVKDDQIKEFEDRGVAYEEVKNPTERYPWESVLKKKKKT